MWHRSKSFVCNVVFKIFRLRRFHSLPLGFSNFATTFVMPLGDLFARHGWCHRSFQLSPRIFENFFAFFVIRIDKVNSSRFPSVVELRFFFCPFQFFSILSGLSDLRPYFWPYMIWSGCRLNFCQSPPRTTKILLKALLSTEWISWTLSMNLTNFLHWFVMQHRILSLSRDVFFMNPFRYWLDSLSCGFMAFSDTTESGLCFRCLGFSLFLKQRFPVCMLEETLFYIAAAFDVSNFRLAFLMMSLCSLSLGSVEWTPLNSLACSSFGFSIAHSCFSPLWAAFPFLVQAPSHMWSGRDVVWIFVCLSLYHKYPFGGVSFNNVNLVKPVHESDRLLSPSTFQ